MLNEICKLKGAKKELKYYYSYILVLLHFEIGMKLCLKSETVLRKILKLSNKVLNLSRVGKIIHMIIKLNHF